MKLYAEHPQKEGCGFSLVLEYNVPPQDDTCCMGVFDTKGEALSLYYVFDLESTGFALPAHLTFEPGDKILLFPKRALRVQKEFSLKVQLNLHEAIILEIASYFIAGTFLNCQQKDPEFFRIFGKVFATSEMMPFTQEEIKQYLLDSELYGKDIQDYFQIPPKTRKVFLECT